MTNALISLLIPCCNRTYNLRKAMPYILAAANYSPPVEIVIVNYNGTDDLPEYVNELIDAPMASGNYITYREYSQGKYYKSTHARNLCAVASHGEYLVQLSAEALPVERYVANLRHRLAKNPAWMVEDSHTHHIYHAYVGRFIVCQRAEFFASGGYDERFEFYAPEDKDLCLRLARRGGAFEVYPGCWVAEIYTPDEDKVRNLNLEQFAGVSLVKREMSKVGLPIYSENVESGALVANPEGWGRWE